jgi:hypothetical protein
MDEILKKIDEEIKRYEIDNSTLGFYFRKGMEHAKEIILSQQKEPCNGCKYENVLISNYPCSMCPRAYTDKYKPLTQPATDTH